MKKIIVIEDLNENFEGISSFNSKKVIINKVLPGETILFKSDKETKKVIFGSVKNIEVPSKNRSNEHICENKHCTGCQLSHINYDFQLSHKGTIMQNIFKLESPAKVTGLNPKGYRNKIILPFMQIEDHLVLGLFKPGSNNIDMQRHDCSVLELPIQEFIQKFKALTFKENFLSAQHYIFMRANLAGEIQLGIGIADQTEKEQILGILNLLSQDSANITSLFYYHLDKKTRNSVLVNNPVFLNDSDHFLNMSLDKEIYKVHPEAFFQINYGTTKEIVKRIITYFQGQATKEAILFDIYSGVGVLSKEIATGIEQNLKRVLVEISVKAFDYLTEDDTTKLMVADINTDNLLDQVESLLQTTMNDSIVILDPPRKGVGEKMMTALKRNKAEYIVYLSCNPKTQAKDILEVRDEYRVDLLEGFDMFPQTKHIESLVILKRKDLA